MFGLLAGFDALVVALGLVAALLLISALLRPLLVGVLGQAPFIGGWLAANVDDGLRRFQASIRTPADNALGILSSSLDWLASQGRNLGDALSGFGAETVNSFTRLVTITIPHAGDGILQQAEALFAQAQGWALGQLQGLEVRLGAELAAARAEGQSLVAQAEATAASDLLGAQRVIGDELGRVERTAGGLFLQAEHEAQLLAGEAEAKAVELVKLARADLGAAVGLVEYDLGQLAKAGNVALLDTASLLGGDLAAAEVRAQAALSGLEASTAKSIEGILGSLPWAGLAARVGAGEAMLRADVRTLVGLGAKAVRDEIGNAEAIRAKYGPLVRAALADLRARV